jgi:hypothetical protein
VDLANRSSRRARVRAGAITAFKLDMGALVAIAVTIMLGCIGFGFLSLWELPRIVARFQKIQFEVNPSTTSAPVARGALGDRDYLHTRTCC